VGHGSKIWYRKGGGGGSGTPRGTTTGRGENNFSEVTGKKREGQEGQDRTHYSKKNLPDVPNKSQGLERLEGQKGGELYPACRKGSHFSYSS